MSNLEALKEFMQKIVDDPEMTDGWDAFIAVQVKISELEAAQLRVNSDSARPQHEIDEEIEKECAEPISWLP